MKRVVLVIAAIVLTSVIASAQRATAGDSGAGANTNGTCKVTATVGSKTATRTVRASSKAHCDKRARSTGVSAAKGVYTPGRSSSKSKARRTNSNDVPRGGGSRN